MRHLRNFVLALSWLTLSFPLSLYAAPDEAQLSVWVNEAIVATYTYNYKNFLARQKEIAHYFTADGWQLYSKDLLASKLPQAVQTNGYFVSAVATMPPVVKSTGTNQWQASMPLLVVYKNPAYEQKQTLRVILNFKAASTGEGVRGLAVTHMASKVEKPICQCEPEKK